MMSIEEYLAQLQQILGRLSLDDIQGVVKTLLEGHEAGAKVFVIGNGGSAATASHLACDLSKSTIISGVPRFRVIALTDNTSLITAWASDMSYGDIFVEQLHGLLDPGDIVIAISANGNSECVIRAVRMAKWRGARTISLTGCGGGKLAPLTDVSVVVPSACQEQVEDAHLALTHSICMALYQTLRKKARFSRGQWQGVERYRGIWKEGRLPFAKVHPEDDRGVQGSFSEKIGDSVPEESSLEMAVQNSPTGCMSVRLDSPTAPNIDASTESPPRPASDPAENPVFRWKLKLKKEKSGD
ncbi:MAG: SIS domain-containing protein [Anaerolineae bacterium]|jgi:D-sedoheptulose 7-phosphate isomerase|nr:SIS domain-containing protein [Anaerolineae bacterium]MDH7475586.1 SIS domain-containing protein [Anaerolineae bacterium]